MLARSRWARSQSQTTPKMSEEDVREARRGAPLRRPAMVDVGGRCDQARVGTEANGRNGERLRDRAGECDETVERGGVR